MLRGAKGTFPPTPLVLCDVRAMQLPARLLPLWEMPGTARGYAAAAALWRSAYGATQVRHHVRA
eukprot:2545755-Rhodomonas_salina.2